MHHLEIILTGALVATCCSLLGCFLILRKMAMIGDAISHAVLPGIVIAYLLTGGARESVVMLIGAAALGLITTFLIEFFHRKARLQEDAAIGITFTALFALGVILVSMYAGRVDLDQDCVLYGEIALTPIDRWYLADGSDLGPVALWVMSGVLLLILTFLGLGYKELLLTTFDPAFASAVGVSVALWHYLLMGAVSVTTVAAFESVGAILVVAFLIAPPATAYLLTDQLDRMLLYAFIAGLISSVGGYLLAYWLDGSIAGAMSAIAGLEFTLALLFSPSYGVLRKRLKLAKSS